MRRELGRGEGVVVSLSSPGFQFENTSVSEVISVGGARSPRVSHF